MQEYLQGLNDSQREAVLHRDGPIMIVAGAGSGKTKVLTTRIAHLMATGVDSFQILALTFTNKAAAEMKKDPSVTFILKGYASAEGSDAHNMQLSVDRANSVKTYLVNSGVNGANISTKGFGEANPVADNSTEAGRVINRRVEIRKQ